MQKGIQVTQEWLCTDPWIIQDGCEESVLPDTFEDYTIASINMKFLVLRSHCGHVNVPVCRKHRSLKGKQV